MSKQEMQGSDLVILDDHGGVKDKAGAPIQTRRSMTPDQAAKHRHDPAFDAALDSTMRAELDKPAVAAEELKP